MYWYRFKRSHRIHAALDKRKETEGTENWERERKENDIGIRKEKGKRQ